MQFERHFFLCEQWMNQSSHCRRVAAIVRRPYGWMEVDVCHGEVSVSDRRFLQDEKDLWMIILYWCRLTWCHVNRFGNNLHAEQKWSDTKMYINIRLCILCIHIYIYTGIIIWLLICILWYSYPVFFPTILRIVLVYIFCADVSGHSLWLAFNWRPIWNHCFNCCYSIYWISSIFNLSTSRFQGEVNK